jgi:hypothetical protein
MSIAPQLYGKPLCDSCYGKQVRSHEHFLKVQSALSAEAGAASVTGSPVSSVASSTAASPAPSFTASPTPSVQSELDLGSRDLRLGLDLVQEVHDTRNSEPSEGRSAVEKRRKAMFDLILFSLFSAADRSVEPFLNGKSKALGLGKRYLTGGVGSEYCQPDMERRIVRLAELVLDRVCILAKAGDADGGAVRRAVSVKWLPNLRNNCDTTVRQALVVAFKRAETLAVAHKLGPTRSQGRQILSIVALQLNIRDTSRLFGASEYAVKQARLHAAENGPGGLATVEVWQRLCRADCTQRTFDLFIDRHTDTLAASEDHAKKGLVRVLKGEPASLHRDYEAFCESLGEESFCLRVFYDLCSHAQGFQSGRLETCVCSWCKDGLEVFQRLLKMLDGLPTGDDRQKDLVDKLKGRATAFYRRLRDGRFANQCLRPCESVPVVPLSGSEPAQQPTTAVAPASGPAVEQTAAPAVRPESASQPPGALAPTSESVAEPSVETLPVAAHCCDFLLSVQDIVDGDKPFVQKCKHNGIHGGVCPHCEEIVLLRADIKSAVVAFAPLVERARLLEVTDRCFGGESGILRFIAHLVRDFRQGQYRDDVLRRMLWYQILVWCDYAQKWLPLKKLQTIADRMGLSGVSVHNFVVIKKLGGQRYAYSNFRVISDDATQDCNHSLDGLKIVLTEEKKTDDRSAEALVGTDNAVNYSGVAFAAGLLLMHKLTGIRVIRQVTNEPGMGKDICNAMWSGCARALRSYVTHKQDVLTAADVARALDDHPSLRGGNWVMDIVRPQKQAKAASLPYKAISRDVSFPEKGGMILRLSLNVGRGLYVSRERVNGLWSGNDPDSLQTVGSGTNVVVGPVLSGTIRPHHDVGDMDDSESVSAPLVMPMVREKTSKEKAREERRARRQERERRKTEKTAERLNDERNLNTRLVILYGEMPKIYRCTTCSFRCFIELRLKDHTCKLVGERVIKGRKRKGVIPVPGSRVVGSAMLWTAVESVGTETGTSKAADADDDAADAADAHAADAESEDSSSSGESDMEGGHGDSDWHSDNCEMDVSVVAEEEDFDGEDNDTPASLTPVVPVPTADLLTSIAPVMSAAPVTPAAPVSTVASVASELIFVEGSCRYPSARRGAKFPLEVVARMRDLFSLKLKAPQVLELLEIEHGTEYLEEHEITTRRIKSWQGSEHQRRVKKAKLKVVAETASSGPSSSSGTLLAPVEGKYSGMNNTAMQDLLVSRGLKRSGVKAELITRLEQDDLARRIESHYAEEEPTGLSRAQGKRPRSGPEPEEPAEVNSASAASAPDRTSRLASAASSSSAVESVVISGKRSKQN